MNSKQKHHLQGVVKELRLRKRRGPDDQQLMTPFPKLDSYAALAAMDPAATYWLLHDRFELRYGRFELRYSLPQQ